MRQINFTFSLDVTYREGVNYHACNRKRKAGMDVSIHFNTKETGIYLSWSMGGKYYKQAVSSRILPVEWDFDLNRPSKKNIKNRDLSIRLNSIMSKVEMQYSNMRLNDLPITADTIKTMVKRAINGHEFKPNQVDFWQAFEEVVDEKTQLCRPSTVAKYHVFKKTLKRFEVAKYPMSFAAVDKRWYKDFMLFSIGLGHLNNTIGKNIRLVKVVMNYSYDMKYHQSLDFKKFKAEFETTDPIFLNREELTAIEKFDTGQNVSMSVSKSLFLLGCYTSQRISDLMALKIKDLKIQGNGDMWWDVHQIKGRKLVRVYIVNKARKILERYMFGKGPNDHIFPKQSPVVTNRNLKVIGMGAGLNTEVTKVNYSGQFKKEVCQPKYMFLTTHTARRTAISLMCGSGMLDHEIQAVSGHSSSREIAVYKGVDFLRIRDNLSNLFEKVQAANSA